MKKRIVLINLSLILILVLIFSPGALASDFSDVSGHWAEENIDDWSSYGIISGYPNGSFKPNNYITRGEMAAILDRVMQYQDKAENTFRDLSGTEWYADPILKLNAAGVILGYEDNTVRPTKNITREEAVVMIYRAYGLDKYATGQSSGFSDRHRISSWAADEVNCLASLGFINGYPDNTFRPQNPITRAEIITIIDNTIARTWDNSGLYCTDINGNVLINGYRTILHNCYISGNVFISESVPGTYPQGEVILQNCVVEGEIIDWGDAPLTIIDGPNTGQINHFYYGASAYPILSGVAHNNLNAGNFSHSGCKTFYNEQVAEPVVTARNGIDVSYWQSAGKPAIDWNKVAADDVDFVIVKIGGGATDDGEPYRDSYSHSHITGAQAAGLDVGVYWYSQAIIDDNTEHVDIEYDVIDEANECLDYLYNIEINGNKYPTNYNITYPVVFDWEVTSRTTGVSNTTLTACAKLFCDIIADADHPARIAYWEANDVPYDQQNHNEYTPMIYSNKSWALGRFKLDQLTAYDFWFAGYTSYPEFYYGFDIWQYSSTGLVNGIQGYVDMNIHFIYEGSTPYFSTQGISEPEDPLVEEPLLEEPLPEEPAGDEQLPEEPIVEDPAPDDPLPDDPVAEDPPPEEPV